MGVGPALAAAFGQKMDSEERKRRKWIPPHFVPANRHCSFRQRINGPKGSSPPPATATPKEQRRRLRALRPLYRCRLRILSHRQGLVAPSSGHPNPTSRGLSENQKKNTSGEIGSAPDADHRRSTRISRKLPSRSTPAAQVLLPQIFTVGSPNLPLNLSVAVPSVRPTGTTAGNHTIAMELRLEEKEQGDARGEEQVEEEEEEEEEYVLLDLDNVYQHGHLPENVPYFLSDLDTLNPRLIIGDGLNLIGEYEETIGTCYIFSETDGLFGLAHKETGPSEVNLFKETSIVGPGQSPSRQVKPIAGLRKILKFKMAAEDESVTAAAKKDESMMPVARKDDVHQWIIDG